VKACRVSWKRSARQDLKKISPQYIPSIIKAIESLEENPLPQGCWKLVTTERFYRIRIGDYRVTYEINSKKKEVTIYYIKHRREAYRKF